jgi:hypothetical protein
MKRFLLFIALATGALILASCSNDQPTRPETTAEQFTNPIDNEQISAQLVQAAGWEIEDAEALPQVDTGKYRNFIVDFEREDLTANIVHFRWDVRVGLGDRDVISVHRVVRMRGPNRPIKTRLNIFLQHGDAKDFRGMFLPATLSENLPENFGAAIYWADQGVDVWGIDQAWNLTEADETEFSYMAEWGITRQAQDLGRAVAMARLVRRATGSGFGKMNLLGYSSGSATGYALVNAETQLPRGHRQVGSWIPVDFSPISDNLEWNEIAFCMFIEDLQTQVDNGEYGGPIPFALLGNLARNDPDGDSPVFPGFTNMQAAMFMGAGPIFGYGGVHYLAGVWENDMPVDLVYVTVDQWLDFMVAGSPYEPNLFMLDYSVWGCMETDVPWDDHFSEVTVPVLNLGGAGGIGPTTGWCLTQLGSPDITDLQIQFLSDEEALFDFGHIDLWLANNAPELVWQPVLQWVDDHTPGNGNQGHNGNNGRGGHDH